MRGYPSNVLSLKPHPYFCTIYLLLIFIQFALLYLQRLWGPRFLIPLRFRQVQYKYLETFVESHDLE
jgi:hypothetical protein